MCLAQDRASGNFTASARLPRTPARPTAVNGEASFAIRSEVRSTP